MGDELTHGARNCCEFGGIRPHEDVLVVTDADAERVAVDALVAAARDRGARVSVLMREVAAHAAEPLPGFLAAAACAADVVLDCGTRFNVHQPAAWRAIHESGTRWIAVEPSLRVLTSRASRGDLEEVRRVTKAVREKVAGRTLRVTDEDGTDIRYCADADDVGGAALDLARMPGTWGVFPPGVVHINPRYGSANGVVYFDAVDHVAGGLQGLGAVHQKWEVRDSWVVEVSGGAADLLLRAMEGRKNARYFAEGSIGTNALAEPLLDGNHLFDSRVAGSMHMAVGDERLSGSRVSAELHWDNLLLHPTLTVVETGERIIEGGRLLVD